MSVLDTMRAIAPEYATFTDAQLDAYIKLATARLSPSRIPIDTYPQMVAFLAAHLCGVAHGFKDTGGSTPITGKRAGQVSVNFSQAAFVKDFELTRWGREYLALLKQCPNAHASTTSPLFR